MNQYVLGLNLDTLPDVRFNYSNESVQLLGLIIEKVSKKPLDRVFTDLLFKPLCMDSTRMSRDSEGNVSAFGGGITTLQDAAQVGLLMRNMGQYQGRQIVSEQWVKASITPSKRAPYYGYLVAGQHLETQELRCYWRFGTNDHCFSRARPDFSTAPKL
ncbi:MAG: serine hydrolase [Haliscomenobacter sp.]|nr:serine hydrolase [Haliscomenobacter sp.]MBK9488065.1 serine hydrolase [Haliscomenobacter sp.]